MAEIFEVNGKKIWVPTGPPKRLLPPDVEVKVTLDEMLDLAMDRELNEYAKIVYERSGRYLGIFNSQVEADQADPYRFARKFIPGGRLPWEI